MDPRKRDNKLEHVSDHINEEDPRYANMTEVRITLRITEPQRREIARRVGEWVKQNRETAPKGLRTQAEKDALSPLITLLFQEYSYLFDDVPAEDKRTFC